MDTAVSRAVGVVHLDDVIVERWFELICGSYEGLAESDKGDWQRFVAALTEGALSAGIDGTLVEQFVEHMAASDLAPLDTVSQMATLSSELPMHYREFATLAVGNAPTAEDDGSAWQPFLAENGVRWDGAEASWEQFRVWFLYEAEQRGLQVPASGFITYAESQQDKVAVFALYQVPITPSDAKGGDQQKPVDANTFPDTKHGDAGEWVEYLDTMLTHNGF